MKQVTLKEMRGHSVAFDYHREWSESWDECIKVFKNEILYTKAGEDVVSVLAKYSKIRTGIIDQILAVNSGDYQRNYWDRDKSDKEIIKRLNRHLNDVDFMMKEYVTKSRLEYSRSIKVELGS